MWLVALALGCSSPSAGWWDQADACAEGGTLAGKAPPAGQAISAPPDELPAEEAASYGQHWKVWCDRGDADPHLRRTRKTTWYRTGRTHADQTADADGYWTAYREWDELGRLRIEGACPGDVCRFTHTWWHDDEHKALEGVIDADGAQGEWTEWGPDGTVVGQGVFEDGVLTSASVTTSTLLHRLGERPGMPTPWERQARLSTHPPPAGVPTSTSEAWYAPGAQLVAHGRRLELEAEAIGDIDDPAPLREAFRRKRAETAKWAEIVTDPAQRFDHRLAFVLPGDLPASTFGPILRAGKDAGFTELQLRVRNPDSRFPPADATPGRLKGPELDHGLVVDVVGPDYDPGDAPIVEAGGELAAIRQVFADHHAAHPDVREVVVVVFPEDSLQRVVTVVDSARGDPHRGDPWLTEPVLLLRGPTAP